MVRGSPRRARLQEYAASKVEKPMDLITIMLAGLLLVAAAARAKSPATEAADTDKPAGPKGEPRGEPRGESE